MLIRLSSTIIKRIRHSYCVQHPQLLKNKQNNDLETQLEQEWIFLTEQNKKNNDSEVKETEEAQQKKEMEESDSDSDEDDDDDPKGGRKIPLIELVKGFIPRLLKPEPQE